MQICSPTAAQTLKLISYNIHHGTNKGGRNTLEEIGEFLKLQKADLIGLQEVDSMCNRSGIVDQMKELAALTGMHYAFARHFAYDGGAYGLGILSRYPIPGERNDRISSKSKGGEKNPWHYFLLKWHFMVKVKSFLPPCISHWINPPD